MSKNRTQRIKTEDLKIGMFVSDVGRGWLRHPWKTKSKTITSQTDIKQLLDHNITEVTIDLDRGADSNGYVSEEFGVSKEVARKARMVTPRDLVEKIPKANPQSPQPKKMEDVERRKKPRPTKREDTSSLADELPQARQTYLKALNVTREFINDVRAGKKIQVGLVQEHVNDMIDSVYRNRNALLALSKLRDYDEYTFTHSLNVATLSLSLGRNLGLSREHLEKLGLGAMFHDLGKMKVPDEILNKPGRLTEDEFEVMKNHPEYGARLLEEQGRNLPEGVIDIVNHHHERLDGTGYPDGLADKELTPYMIISGMADVYDALSSKRVYKDGMMPHDALKIIFTLRGTHFPPAWVDRFIQSMGIYPVGTVVELTTKETGVVVSVNNASLARPEIRLLKNPLGRSLSKGNTLDLNHELMGDVEVKRVLDPKKLGIDPSKFILP